MRRASGKPRSPAPTGDFQSDLTRICPAGTERSTPIITGKTQVHRFTWQPHGSQFTIIEDVPADNQYAGGRILTLLPRVAAGRCQNSQAGRLRYVAQGFQSCCVADCQIGGTVFAGLPAGLDARDTADLAVCATGPTAWRTVALTENGEMYEAAALVFQSQGKSVRNACSGGL
jgi:hypothetical protein